MPRILTGDRPTGQLHIGHYFGSLKERVALQHDFETFILIADVQALTDNFEQPEIVRQNVFEGVLDNLAVGIDPHRSTFVIQSCIPEIAELTVFYGNLVTVSRLQQNPTVKTEVKQKQALFKQSVTYGFLGYPVSQAADITAFQADLVPVGKDQLPMLEQTREIVRKFNRIYGDALPEPQAKLGAFPRVKGLDGNAKMSKSLNNAIFLADESEVIQEKVMKAVTDPNKNRLKDAGNPDVCTVIEYHQMFGNAIEVKKECLSGARGCVFCKKQLAQNISATLEPIQEKRRSYQNNLSSVKDMVFEGTQQARVCAQETLTKVKTAMQLNYV